MRSSIFVSVAAFAGAAIAQSSSIDPAPQTKYLTQTNSLGVITGGPAAATSIPSQPAADTSIPSQPAVVTSQPAVATNVGVPASIPAVAPGIWTIPVPAGGNNTSLLTYIVSANNSTTVIIGGPGVTPSASTTGSGSAASATGSGSGSATRSGSASGSATGSSSPANSQGAAANVQVAAGSLLGFGALMAAFL